MPIGDGQFETAGLQHIRSNVLHGDRQAPLQSVQSRCISLPMRPATEEEAAKLKRFRAKHAPALKECGRKFARWAADLTELPDVEVPEHFVNRIADNWRVLFQIAHLAGGDLASSRSRRRARRTPAGDGEERGPARGQRAARRDLARPRGRDDEPAPHAHVGARSEADGPRRWSLAGGEPRQADRRVLFACEAEGLCHAPEARRAMSLKCRLVSGGPRVHQQ